MSLTQKLALTVDKGKTSAEVAGTIPEDVLATYEKEVIDAFSNSLDIDGFRKGSIPEKVIREKVPATSILEEQASRALNEAYPLIVKENDLDVFGRPQVNLKKLAPGNPVEFSLSIPLAPSLTLPDYKKIAADVNKNKEEVVVEDSEVEAAILKVREQLDEQDKAQQAAGDSEEKDEGADKKESEGEAKEPSPLTDEKVQKISPAQTVEEFEKLVREQLAEHKEKQAADKHRVAILDTILEKSDITVPEQVVESELAGMVAQFEQDLAQTGARLPDYLESIGKTKEDIEKEWRPQAEKRTKIQLLLNKIVVEEDLMPKDEEVEAQVDMILKNQPDVPKDRAKVYVETQLANQSALELLESQGSKKEEKKSEKKESGTEETKGE